MPINVRLILSTSSDRATSFGRAGGRLRKSNRFGPTSEESLLKLTSGSTVRNSLPDCQKIAFSRPAANRLLKTLSKSCGCLAFTNACLSKSITNLTADSADKLYAKSLERLEVDLRATGPACRMR